MRFEVLTPNPVNGDVSYRIHVLHGGPVKVGIYDVAGRLIVRLIEKDLPPGTHDFSWIPESILARGTYLLRLDSGEVHEARKIVLIR